ncbi:MAG: choline dehydrogenase-like flavoprotein [Lentisphaeria bacterium]|jgi:choline dehydrogenase-like flavoprotein
MLRNDRIVNLSSSPEQSWDVVVVGGGMGGATIASELAKKGNRVLLLEKGLASFDSATGEGVEVEQPDPERRLKNGRWPTRLTAIVDGNRSDIWAPLGCGLGGSTLLYAAALQRLLPIDFDEQQLPNGDTVAWPFDYAEIEPYYQQAEQLFSVCGTNDPLESGAEYFLAPPPAMCDSDQHYFDVFKSAGLNPYRLHVGIQYKSGCGECGGYICKSDCKRDAFNSCILPGLESGNLYIAERADVERIEANDTSVTAVKVKQNEKTFSVAGKVVVLSAGAFFTPVILQNSYSENWPHGLANGSGLVGKNLMFHAGDFLAFWPKLKRSRKGPNKTIALRDFYTVDGNKMGEFQSTGLKAGYGVVLYALRLLFDQSPFKRLKPLRYLLNFPALFASKIYGDATVFATIVEDFPYPENCIVADSSASSGMHFEYHIKDELTSRLAYMRKHIRKQLSVLRSIPMNFGANLNFGHPCGTCKAGNDVATSVLDKNCKAHELENLYVVDSSFMPTSGGTNPSLTIAANALRVANVIDRSLKQS